MSTDPPPQPAWSYQNLLELLSQERLGSYLAAAEDDVDAAFALYEWNMRAASEVMHTTGMVEVVVRNALDRQLRSWAASRRHTSWLDEVPLDPRGRDDIRKARERATNYGREPEVHGKVVAELSLGFWRFLVARRYLTILWIPALHAAFPHATDDDLLARQRAVDRALRDLGTIRNRAAHHEPIHRRDLARDHRTCVSLAQWVDPTAGAWVAARAELAAVASRKP